MKKLAFVCLALLLGTMVFAQNNPHWLWANTAGGVGNDVGYSISRDNAGNLYVAGLFVNTAQFGDYTVTSAGGNDIFIAKMSPNGIWLWAVRAGGTGNDLAYSISTDAVGDSYVTGYFSVTAEFGPSSLTSSGNADVFLTKLDTNGNWLWATRGGGPWEDWGLIVAVRDGYIYLTGKFMGTSTFGLTSISSYGGHDVFIARLDANGHWAWVKKAGGAAEDEGGAVSIDAAGNCYVCGYMCGTVSFGTITLSGNGFDVFVTKLDPDGNWIWAICSSGSGTEGGWSIATDDNGYSNVTGLFTGTAIIGNTTLNCLGSHDVFIARIDPDGNWMWARRAGGPSVLGDNTDVGCCIALENSGMCCVTGYFYGADADFGQFVLTNSGGYNYFIAQLDNVGNWVWAITGDGTLNDSCWGVCMDGLGNLYHTGAFMGTMNYGPSQITSSGERDVWVAKLALYVPVDDELAPDASLVSSLSAAWPNPFHPGETTTLKANVASSEHGAVTLYNLRGQIIKSEGLVCGEHLVSLKADDLPAGIYFYQLRTQSVSITRKLVLLK